ncbi:MAG: nucleotidyltransferase family protein, partial [Ruminococcus sp.]|nr:nucleotidyltransferase family protein [Ruminococcus sp.]
SFEYKFTDEAFYIYMIAHEYKHFSNGGTGLRSLVDTYVYLNKFSDIMNWEYIHEECQKLEIDEFEEKSRKLALKVFSSTDFPELNEDEEKMLDYYLGSGTYGTVSNKALNRMKKLKAETGEVSKLKYFLHRVFPPLKVYKNWFPFFYKYKFLLPIGWAYRLLRGIFCKNRMIKAEIKAIKNIPHARK